MSQPFNSHTAMPPLSVGNIVTAGFQIYRAHFKLYFRLALFAHLWLLVPLYGWAKFLTIAALISRLAFNEIYHSSESLESLKKSINSRKLTFLWACILILFRIAFFVICLTILTGFWLAFVANTGSHLIRPATFFNNKFLAISFSLLFLLIISATPVIFIAIVTWFYAHFFLVDIVLAREDKMKAERAIARSWSLSKGFSARITGILTIAFLITLPAQVIIQSVNFFWPFINSYLKNKDTLIFQLLILVMVALINAFMMPLWQAIKGVLYYDILNRRQGLSLGLRQSQASGQENRSF